MIPARPLPLASLLLLVAVPLAWLACGGGGTKPPEAPAGESSASATSEAPASSDSAGSAASSASASEKSDTPAAASPSSDGTASTPPSAPSFGSTDCGKCVDKTCAKQETACGKITDCEAVLESIHGCSATAAS